MTGIVPAIILLLRPLKESARSSQSRGHAFRINQEQHVVSRGKTVIHNALLPEQK
jgi:hypothetical protein